MEGELFSRFIQLKTLLWPWQSELDTLALEGNSRNQEMIKKTPLWNIRSHNTGNLGFLIERLIPLLATTCVHIVGAIALCR